MFLENLKNELDKFHLLRHPFYQDWNAGTLSKEDLQEYSKQYFHHVKAFPMYLRKLHSNCKDAAAADVIWENLRDEEDASNNGKENHPKLWLDFVEELGCSRASAEESKMFSKTKALVEGFMELASHSYEKGLGIYAYERQVPDVAANKIDGLQKFYGIKSEKALKFFKVHMKADEWHAQEFEQLIEKLDKPGRELAKEGAIEAAKLLWDFLNGIQDYRALNSMAKTAANDC